MRLVDADALPKYTGYALSANEVAKAVENAPTVDAVSIEDYRSMEQTVNKLTKAIADAEPVKHGHWNEEMGGGYICSLCERFSDFATNYCPHCGAKIEIDEKRD